MSKPESWTNIEPSVEELSGILEIPLTGFVLQPRGGTIRMLGFILRGYQPNAVAENTTIIHFPKFGFLNSWHHAEKRLAQPVRGLSTQ